VVPVYANTNPTLSRYRANIALKFRPYAHHMAGCSREGERFSTINLYSRSCMTVGCCRYLRNRRQLKEFEAVAIWYAFSDARLKLSMMDD
jgi:hypothetical protein